MSSSDRFMFNPTVPTFFMVDSTQYKNDLTEIFHAIIDICIYYAYPFIWIKCHVTEYPCMKPPGFTSGWIKGFLNLQNDTLDYDEIGTWWASGVNEAWIGFVYNIDNVVSITWEKLAESGIVID